jgi:hypothetical protein
MKPGRIVILLAGRHAGKKAIIVKQYDDGKKVCNTLRSIFGMSLELGRPREAHTANESILNLLLSYRTRSSHTLLSLALRDTLLR